VVDFVGRAQGNYAYCEVIRGMLKHTTEFRVLALSATPGSNSQSIQQVVDNLLIAHLEYRAENSLDVAPYVHGRQVRDHSRKKGFNPTCTIYQIEKIVVPMGQELQGVRERFKLVITPFLQRLAQARAYNVTDADKLNTFMLTKAREAYSARMANNEVTLTEQKKNFVFSSARFQHGANENVGLVLGDFSVVMSLSHAYNLLHQHGVRAFYYFLQARFIIC